MLVRFSHVQIGSARHAESVKWYCEKLGYEIDYNAPGVYASLHHKLLGRLAIHVVDGKPGTGGAMPYYLCDDIETTIKDLRAKGLEVSNPEREGESPRFAHFQDLDGNYWGIEEL